MLWTKQVLTMDRASTVSFNLGISDVMMGCCHVDSHQLYVKIKVVHNCWLQTFEEFALHDIVNTKLENTVMEQIRVA